MKFVIILYIALGFVLSLFVGLEYNCVGQEMFPIYYGSPFIFMQKSLGSSMEYYYSISGLILNISLWSLVLVLIRNVFLRLMEKIEKNKIIMIIYKGIIGVLIAFTTLNIYIHNAIIGRGFQKGSNYWYMNIDKEAKDWGMKCEGELIFFKL